MSTADYVPVQNIIGKDIECKDSKVIEEKSAGRNRFTPNNRISNNSDNNNFKILQKEWRNRILRGVFSLLLISYFCLTIYLGPVVIIATTLILQAKCFSEIIDIGYKVYPVNELPLFKLVSWYFLLAANYFCYGETLAEHFDVFINELKILKLLINYHRFFSFCMYFIGIILFVLSLRKKYDMHQFSLLACTHVALLLIVLQSFMIVKNIFQGLIWLIIPVTSVVCNDITAYLFGKLVGRTPLIQVSPNKTWEGFLGAAVSTILYACLTSNVLCKYSYFVCPIQYIKGNQGIQMSTECVKAESFVLNNYTVSLNATNLLQGTLQINAYPFVVDALVISAFCSIIAPFGGFFASGFKRAFQVKDFGGIIPGHGGVLDRFDCQFLVATFVNVYITSFVRYSTPEKIFQKVLYLEANQQLQFFYKLRETLKERNIML